MRLSEAVAGGSLARSGERLTVAAEVFHENGPFIHPEDYGRFNGYAKATHVLDERSEIELQVAEGERQNEMFPPTRPKNHLKNKIKIKTTLLGVACFPAQLQRSSAHQITYIVIKDIFYYINIL